MKLEVRKIMQRTLLLDVKEITGSRLFVYFMLLIPSGPLGVFIG